MASELGMLIRGSRIRILGAKRGGSRFFALIAIFGISFATPSHDDFYASYVGEVNDALLAKANLFLHEDAVARILDLARYDASLTGI